MAILPSQTYRNVFAELGIPEGDVNRRIDETWSTMFYGPDDQRLFFPVGDDLGYILDTGNDDARTEGMSYGMMMAVQMDDQDAFDRIWRWSVKFMQHADGPMRHYFAWSVNTDGTRRAEGPAPDGEEYFALALFFASHRWGDGPAPLDYSVQARSILRACVHQDELTGGHPMWDRSNGLIKFVPSTPWTDPSYHLPHFYDLFALWADEADRPFWARAAAASRAYLPRACHPVTGLAPEYADFDGTPHRADWDYGHHKFYSDSYRVAANVGLDAAWTGGNPAWRSIAARLLGFFAGQDTADLRLYELDGTPTDEPALHPVGLVATNAAAALAVDAPTGRQAVELFWKTPPRTGPRRYYDNCLYFFALLALSGRYRVWRKER
jgi:oligosaccharide reducing-end xylanase